MSYVLYKCRDRRKEQTRHDTRVLRRVHVSRASYLTWLALSYPTVCETGRNAATGGLAHVTNSLHFSEFCSLRDIVAPRFYPGPNPELNPAANPAANESASPAGQTLPQLRPTILYSDMNSAANPLRILQRILLLLLRESCPAANPANELLETSTFL